MKGTKRYPPHIKPHSSGTGWTYQLAIRAALKSSPAVKKWVGASHWNGYIAASSVTSAGYEAADRARDHKAIMTYLEGLTENQREAFLANGGLDDLRKRVKRQFTPHLTPQFAMDLIDRSWIEDPVERIAQETFQRAVIRKVMDQERADTAALQHIEQLQVIPNPEHGWDGLFKLWEGKGCRRSKAQIRALALLREHFGEAADFRKVTAQQMKEFRNFLGTYVQKSGNPIPLTMQSALMMAVKGMFTAAYDRLPELKPSDNPCQKISIKRDRKRRGKWFTGSEVRAILGMVDQTKWGGKRHAEVRWLVRLACFQGLRPSEIAQLRQADIAKNARGIAYLKLRHGDGQSLKTGREAERDVPLHPECAAFYNWAHLPKKGPDGKSTRDVFGAFPSSGRDGRAHWLSTNFVKFRRHVCEIENDLPFYGFRMTFVTARRRAGVSMEMGEFLTGHATDNMEGEYGGTDVDSLYELMMRIDPRTIPD